MRQRLLAFLTQWASMNAGRGFACCSQCLVAWRTAVGCLNLVPRSLLAIGCSEASAWVCFATGLGSGGAGRSYSVIDAKLLALRRCERHSPLPHLYDSVVPPQRMTAT